MLSDLDLIALCDISLQSSIPGPSLYIILDAVSKGNITINKPEDIYNFFKDVNFLNQDMKITDALRVSANLAIKQLSSYLKIDTLSNEYQDWVIFTITAGVEMRIQHPYFFLDMTKCKRDKENAILQYLAKNIGSPQMINAKGKRFQLVTDRPICRFEYFEVVRQIENLFEYGTTKCNLKSWCKISPDGAPVDERCDNAPWQRCNDVRLCPYALLWKHWNLNNKRVIIKSENA